MFLDFLFTGRKKPEKRPVWHWGEDRRIQRIMMEVESGFCEDTKTRRAYHMIHDFMMRDLIGGGLTILVWQRDAFPKHPFRKLDDTRKAQLEQINTIANERAKTAKDKALEDSRNMKMATMLTSLGYAFGITILLGIIFMVWQGGGFKNFKLF